MSLVVMPVEVLSDPLLTHRERILLATLFSFRGKATELVWPSREAIARRMGGKESDISFISKTTTKLQQLGWIEKKKRGFSGSNKYRLKFPDRLLSEEELAVKREEEFAQPIEKPSIVVKSTTIDEKQENTPPIVVDSTTTIVADSTTSIVVDSTTYNELTNEQTNDLTKKKKAAKAASSPPPKKSRRTPTEKPLPMNWTPSEHNIRSLVSGGINMDFINSRLHDFIGYFTDTGEPKKSWGMAFVNWVRKDWKSHLEDQKRINKTKDASISNNLSDRSWAETIMEISHDNARLPELA